MQDTWKGRSFELKGMETHRLGTTVILLGLSLNEDIKNWIWFCHELFFVSVMDQWVKYKQYWKYKI